MPAASSKYTPGKLNAIAPGSPLAIMKSGYIYVWVSNETQGWDVFFDNLSVQHKQGPLLEENHYYPFGLAMAGLSDKAIKSQYSENKFRYNGGNEKQDKEFSDGSGWEMYDAGFRMYDQQTGRFGQIDPLADAMHLFSTYQFAGNNPVSMNDPLGLKQIDPSVIAKMHQLPIGGGGGADPNAGMEEAQENVDANFEMADDYLGTGPSGDNTAANIIAQCGDGFTQFVVGDDGTLIQTQYDPNPTAGTFREQSGAWFNSGGMIDDGWDGHYNASQDAFTGGELNTDVFKHSFVALPTLQSSWAAYQNIADGWDYAKATLGMIGGSIEAGVGALTTEFGFGTFLVVDGVSRTVRNGGKIYTLATGGKKIGESAPTNMGAVVGYAIDNMTNSNLTPGEIGNWQTWLGTANETASLIADFYNEPFVQPGMMRTLNSTFNDKVFGVNGVPASIGLDYMVEKH